MGLVLLLVCLAFLFQGTRGIWTPDEGYHSVIALTMLRTGDWLVPHVGHQVWLEKPPLTHWAIAAGMSLIGTNEWGARLFTALGYVLTTLTVFALGRSMMGERGGCLAAVFYATMLLPFAAANILTPDTPLTLWSTAAMTSFWFARDGSGRHAGWWKILLGVTLGLGVLTKGPAALVPCAAMLVFLVVSGRFRTFFLSWATVPGILAFVTIGLGWYGYVGAVVPGGLDYLWHNHVLGRLATTEYHRNPGLAGALNVYLPYLLVGTFPASAFWWVGARRRLRRLIRPSFWAGLRTSSADLLVACWIVVPSLVFAAASSKLPLYLLPVFPAFALLSARLVQAESRRRDPRAPWVGQPRRLSWALTLWVAVLLAFKLIAATVDSDRDMRSLATTLRSVAPDGPFELVCVDLRCEGILFYFGDAVERVTTVENPYPVFGGTEPLTEETDELSRATYHHVFVYEEKSETKTVPVLSRASVQYSVRAEALPHHRRVWVSLPARETSASIDAEAHPVVRAPDLLRNP